MILNILIYKGLYLYHRQWNEKESENYNKIYDSPCDPRLIKKNYLLSYF